MKKAEMILEAIRVLEIESQAISDCVQRLRQDGDSSRNFSQAVQWFDAALEANGKIIVTGVGKSGKVGQKIAATLCSTGSFAVYLHPTEGLHGDLGMIRAGDAVLALSYTGNTDEVVRLVPLLKARGVKVVGMGGKAQSKLAQECDAWIDGEVRQEACPHNLAPTASTTLALALGDALAVTLMQLRGFKAETFAENHPGGSLGKRLNLRVGDLMHPIGQVGVVGAETSIEEVIVLATQKQLGAVLVLDKGILSGIITDGDIRRSLKHREKFFQLKAHEIMTRRPITIQSEVLARTALELMENRPSQISVLPVTDAQNYCLGLLRLHDLVRTF